MLLHYLITGNCVSQSVEGDELDDEQWIRIISLCALDRTFLKDCKDIPVFTKLLDNVIKSIIGI